MGLQHVRTTVVVTGAAAARDSAPLRVGGQAVDIQAVGPTASVMSAEISNDRQNWVAATDADGAAITNIALASWYREVRERPEWIRFALAAAATNTQDYAMTFGVHKVNN